MSKKILLSILLVNLLLLIWQSILGVRLSTQGDVHSERLSTVNALQNQIDLIDSQIALTGSLDKINNFALQNGFIPARIIRYTQDSLAAAKTK